MKYNTISLKEINFSKINGLWHVVHPSLYGYAAIHGCMPDQMVKSSSYSPPRHDAHPNVISWMY